MQFYLAPLEGVTGYIYRNAIDTYFPGADRYFTPFIVPDAAHALRRKELRDVLPENNQVSCLIPQIMTNDPERFADTVKALADYGYEEVNLNLGCPSGTVVSRKKGAGFLAVPDELDRFLDEIFRSCSCRISVKTRIGMENPEEWLRLMEIYNQYPLSELIIHPRTRKEYYKGEPHREIFSEMKKAAKMPVCYNGNVFSAADYLELENQFPDIKAMMLGRGVIADPALLRQLKALETVGRAGGSKQQMQKAVQDASLTKKELKSFHDDIFEQYREIFNSDVNAMFHMKEFWSYLLQSFVHPEKEAKKLRKAKSLNEYLLAVDQLLRNCELKIPDLIIA